MAAEKKERKEREITFDVDEEFGDYIIDESGNQSLNLRKISWNGRPFKLDLRKYSYSDGGERMLKGVTISEEGADELTGTLVEKGYGDTTRIIKAIRGREDFDESLLDKNIPIEDDGSEDFYDPKQLLNYANPIDSNIDGDDE